MNKKQYVLLALLSLIGMPGLVAEKYRNKFWWQASKDIEYDKKVKVINEHISSLESDQVIGDARLEMLAQDRATLESLLAEVNEFLGDHSYHKQSLDYRHVSEIKVELQRLITEYDVQLGKGFDFLSYVPTKKNAGYIGASVAGAGLVAYKKDTVLHGASAAKDAVVATVRAVPGATKNVVTRVVTKTQAVPGAMKVAASATSSAIKARPFTAASVAASPLVLAALYRYRSALKDAAVATGAGVTVGAVKSAQAVKAHPYLSGGAVLGGVALHQRDKVAAVAKATPGALKAASVLTRDFAKAHPYATSAAVLATAAGTYAYNNWFANTPAEKEKLSADEQKATKLMLAYTILSYLKPDTKLKKVIYGVTIFFVAGKAYRGSRLEEKLAPHFDRVWKAAAARLGYRPTRVTVYMTQDGSWRSWMSDKVFNATQVWPLRR